MEFSDYVVYVDESGDATLKGIDPDFPAFCLAFCVFRKSDYVREIVPLVQNLKFKYWGHDIVILHRNDLARRTGPFSFLNDPAVETAFMQDLDDIVSTSPFTTIAAVIRKDELVSQYVSPEDPYHIAMRFGLERLFEFLRGRNDHNRITHIIVEERGAREDANLRKEFYRIRDGNNFRQIRLPFHIEMANKKCNSSGLQLSDMIAHPIAQKVMFPNRRNRAYDTIAAKLDRSNEGQIDGYGLKVFP